MMFRKSTIALALGLASLASHAASFNFNVSLDSGPLLGQSFSGEYSYAEAAPSGTGFQSLLLTSFSLNFLGHNYGLADATAAPTADFQNGVFLGLSYQYDTPAAVLTLNSGSEDVSDAYFFYKPALGDASGGSFAISAVPEPSTWALGLAGLAVVGSIARRRRQQA
ncbi:PEP-CTERM sorting domain-containing protein [Paucibacter sp. Y2R2-4]|uniref:PEP-CTERM sorting domain-containing protein n=1 Tax=Paucibacter sp. Y2R2-4 TaxID=2893553 RepID=UPI0021E3FA77|nr:PEP-CTERM sorting domain-containing protein [Paucibacter sp. Y2R2-4]MCV2349454.1 PEP-CTERM sorting domain-containing protein [Paucibacter sp. Y2R2-4]